MRFLAAVLAVLALAATSAEAGKLVDSTSGYGYTVTDTSVVPANTLNWPADWSRRAFPLPVHSHNDYWQDVPVLTALSLGCRSIESDVWLYNNELYVGHDPYSLTVNRTFQSLTIAPILEALDQANRANSRYKYSDPTQSNFFAGLQTQILATQASPHNWTGYWQLGVGNSAPIQVLVDVKTNGNLTWPYVVQKLQPLRDLGWLTRYENGKIIPGPVTIIGTGNTPINQVAPLTSRDYFFDCPLGQLNNTAYVDQNGVSYPYNSTLCGIASVDYEHFNGGWEGTTNITAAQAANLTAPVTQAHALGIPTRYWDNPNWPTYARDTVNAFLLSIGSDWINADDLEAIASF